MNNIITEKGFKVNAPNQVIGIHQNATDSVMLYINFIANDFAPMEDINTTNQKVLARTQQLIMGINKSNSTYMQTAGLIELSVSSVLESPHFPVTIGVNQRIELKNGAIMPVIRTFDNTVDIYKFDAKAPIFVKRYNYLQFNTPGLQFANQILNATTQKLQKESDEEEFMHFWFFNKG